MTPLERKGMEIVKKDTEHIYRMEDNGSSIVKIQKGDYINNAIKNYEKLNDDKTDEVKTQVVDLINDFEKNKGINSKLYQVKN